MRSWEDWTYVFRLGKPVFEVFVIFHVRTAT